MKHLQDKAQSLLAQAKALQDESKGAGFTPDQELKFDNLMAEFDATRSQIEKAEKLAAAEAWAGNVTDIVVQGQKDAEKSGDPVMKAWGAFIRNPHDMHKRQAYVDLLEKAHSVAAPGYGGVAVVPTAIAAEIIRLDEDSTWVRQLAPATTLMNAVSLGYVRMDDDGDFNWVSENGTATEGNVTTDRRDLSPKRMTKYFDLSRKLSAYAPDFEQEVLSRARYIVSRTEENAFLTGVGVANPQGFMLEANLASTQVQTTATADTIAGDDLISALERIKSQYRNGCAVFMGRNTESAIRKIKATTTGEYIWQPTGQFGAGLVGAMPGTILDMPYYLSEFAPSDAIGTANGSLTTGAICLAIANLRRGYRIVDAMDIEIDVDNTTKNLAYQTRYVIHKHTDGMIVDDNAFALLKVG